MEKSFGKKDFVNVLVIGFALFAAFFGAGNLIFPPLLGASSGKRWMLGFIAFLIADAGIAVAAVLAVVKIGGGLEGQMRKLWKIPSRILCIIMSLIMGPLAVIPRTCATAYEMSVKPLIPGLNSWIFSVVFFVIVAILTIRPGKVVDIIGKFLTPVLLAALMVLCVKGIVTPLGPVSDNLLMGSPLGGSSGGLQSGLPYEYQFHHLGGGLLGAAAASSGQEVREGLLYGYQTLDALLAVPLSVIVIHSVQDKGYTGKKRQAGMISLSCIVAFIGLFIVYAGLSYLGATVSTLGLGGLSGTELLVEITRQLLASVGTGMLGLIVLLACLTTAIGVGSAIADYFVGLTKNKISYRTMVLLFCAAGIFLSNLGTQSIITLTEPVLSLLYPIFLTQIFMNLALSRLQNPWIYRGAAIGAALFQVLDFLFTKGILNIQFITKMPLWTLGLGWILPAVAGALVGALIRPKGAVSEPVVSESSESPGEVPEGALD